MKKLLTVILLCLILTNIFSAEITEFNENNNQQQTANDIELISGIRANAQAISEIPTNEELNSNFAQLDNKISNLILQTPMVVISLIIGVLIIHDLFLFSIFIILRNRGYI